MAKRKRATPSKKDERPEVPVRITRFEHPNAVRIEIVILGDDANVRASVETAIMMAVNSVLGKAGQAG
jgi:hypothetical protein